MALYPRPVSTRMRAKSRKLMSKFSRRSVRSTGSRAVTAYNSATRGTNPQNVCVFRGVGFPDTLITNLIYTESIILTPSAITPCPYVVYKPNSCYDPNDAVGGGQPTYWDQLAEVYTRYAVLGAKVTATFSLPTQTTANIGPYLCGIEASDTNVLVSTNPNTLLASNNVTYRMIGAQDGTKSVVMTYSPAKNFDPTIAAYTGGSGMTQDPTIKWFHKIFATPQGSAVTTPINVVIVIEFNVKLFDLKALVDA